MFALNFVGFGHVSHQIAIVRHMIRCQQINLLFSEFREHLQPGFRCARPAPRRGARLARGPQRDDASRPAREALPVLLASVLCALAARDGGPDLRSV